MSGLVLYDAGLWLRKLKEAASGAVPDTRAATGRSSGNASPGMGIMAASYPLTTAQDLRGTCTGAHAASLELPSSEATSDTFMDGHHRSQGQIGPPPSIGLRQKWAGYILLLLACITFLLMVFADPAASVMRCWSADGNNRGIAALTRSRQFDSGTAADRPHTLVLYVWGGTDPNYGDNLLFFVRHGMPGCPGCRYVVIINEDDERPVPPPPCLLSIELMYMWCNDQCMNIMQPR